MRLRFAGCTLATAAVAALSVLAGTAGAVTSISMQGSMPNGGCGSVHDVTLSKATRINVLVSSTATETSITYAQILDPAGKLLANSAYNAPAAGTYGVRVCSTADGENPSRLQYSGKIAIGAPPEKRPHATSHVAGVAVTVVTSAIGRAAIRTPSGLTWFTVYAQRGHAQGRSGAADLDL